MSSAPGAWRRVFFSEAWRRTSGRRQASRTRLRSSAPARRPLVTVVEEHYNMEKDKIERVLCVNSVQGKLWSRVSIWVFVL